MRIPFLVVCVFISFAGLCQDTLKTDYPKAIVPRHALKFSPFHLFSFYPTVQLAYEFKVAPAVSIQLDGGIVVDVGVSNDNFRDKRGFKAKVEPRYYFSFVGRRAIGWYLAGELAYNHVDFDRSAEQIECFDPGCVNRFFRKYNFTMNYREQGFALKMGMLKNFYPFLFDISTGFGLRNIDYDAPSYINMDSFESDWIEVPRIKDRITFSPVINFRMGYRIR